MCNLTDTYYLNVKLRQLEKSLTDLNAVIVEKDTITYNKVLRELTNVLVNSWTDAARNGVNKAIEYITGKGEVNFNETDIKEIDSILQETLGMDLASTVESSVMELNQKAVKLGLKEVSKAVKMKLGFDVTDQEAAAILGKHNLFYIGNYYSDQLKGDIGEIIRGYFSGGKTLEEVTADFQSKFGKFTDKGSTYFEGLANHTLNRTREIGHINGYEKAGVIKYEIVAVVDDRTSEICLEMNGKVFEIQNAIDLRDSILGMDDPQSIKDVAPWRTPAEISGKSEADLPSGMEFPPYHFGGCRTTTVAYFE
jgi:SPP1 gp7 family putative phage head morphogenesis protein